MSVCSGNTTVPSPLASSTIGVLKPLENVSVPSRKPRVGRVFSIVTLVALTGKGKCTSYQAGPGSQSYSLRDLDPVRAGHAVDAVDRPLG